MPTLQDDRERRYDLHESKLRSEGREAVILAFCRRAGADVDQIGRWRDLFISESDAMLIHMVLDEPALNLSNSEQAAVDRWLRPDEVPTYECTACGLFFWNEDEDYDLHLRSHG